jgi:hypothetical protein
MYVRSSLRLNVFSPGPKRNYFSRGPANRHLRIRLYLDSVNRDLRILLYPDLAPVRVQLFTSGGTKTMSGRERTIFREGADPFQLNTLTAVIFETSLSMFPTSTLNKVLLKLNYLLLFYLVSRTSYSKSDVHRQLGERRKIKKNDYNFKFF